MKTPFYIFVFFILTACGGVKSDLSELPVVNTVRELRSQRAEAIPLTDEEQFVVSGVIKRNLYILGKGAVELADPTDEQESIIVATKHEHKIGEILTISVKKQSLVTINDEGLDLWIEQ